MSSIQGVSVVEGVSMFNSFYWQIAFWVVGLCVIFFIIVFVISKVKENIREKSQGENKKNNVIL